MVRIFSRFNYVIPQKYFLAIKFMTKMKLSLIFMGGRYAGSQSFWVEDMQDHNILGGRYAGSQYFGWKICRITIFWAQNLQ